MKSSISIHALAALPLFALSSPLGGQYRGPEYEALLTATRPAGSGEGRPSVFVAPTLADGFGSWEFWFEWNKDVMIRSRHADCEEVLGDQPASVLGKGRIEARMVYERIVPALEEAISQNNEALVKICIHALGKTGEGDALAVIEKALGRPDLETRCLAVMALGQLEDRESLARLAGIYLDPSAPCSLRAHAALGLGMRAEPEAAALLRETLEKQLRLGSLGGESEEWMLASIRALGLSGAPDAASFLAKKFAALDRDGHSKARTALCVILSSLGRIGDASALETLTGAMRAKDIELRRAAALACGDLAADGAVAPLAEALEKDSDPQTRGFAAISLGRIGGKVAREALRREFGGKIHRSVKEYCAIALGLAGDEDSVEALRALLKSHEIDTTRAAAAVALGFLGDRSSTSSLLDLVEDRSQSAKFRGYAAIAVGLLRSEEAMPRMLEQLRQRDDKLEEMQRGLILGLGLMRDAAASKDLLRVLAEDKRNAVRGHAALALGMIRDPQAVEPLIEMLDGKGSSESRAFAGVALGALGDRYNYPRVSGLFFNTNYRLRNEVLDRTAAYF